MILDGALRNGLRTFTVHRSIHNGKWIALVSYESGEIHTTNNDDPCAAVNEVLGPRQVVQTAVAARNAMTNLLRRHSCG